MQLPKETKVEGPSLIGRVRQFLAEGLLARFEAAATVVPVLAKDGCVVFVAGNLPGASTPDDRHARIDLLRVLARAVLAECEDGDVRAVVIGNDRSPADIADIARRRGDETAKKKAAEVAALPGDLNYADWQRRVPEPDDRGVSERMATPQSEGGGNGRATGRTTAAVIDPLADQTTERRGSASHHAGARAAEILAPETGLAALDPVSFSKALTRFGTEVARRPLSAIAAVARCGTGLSLTGLAAAGRAVGLKTPGPLPPAAKDKRFADRAWEENAAFFATGQAYRLVGRLVEHLVALAELEEPWNGKASFALRGMVDALAPTNTLLGNPAALQRGLPDRRPEPGARRPQLVTDLATNGGLALAGRPSAVHGGREHGRTPGKVVYRSELIELIQYEPQTETVHEIPLLFCPPWINKYYIMDLAPGRSLVEWAVQHGHTVLRHQLPQPRRSRCATSTFDDYLLERPAARRSTSSARSPAPSRSTPSRSASAARSPPCGWPTRRHRRRTGQLGHVPQHPHRLHPSPALLGAFTDEASDRRARAADGQAGLPRVQRDGPHVRRCAGQRPRLRATSSTTGCMGETPPAFDLLAWNDDSTRMPAKMHSDYLRSCYLREPVGRGRDRDRRHPLDLGAGRQSTPTCCRPIDDHIVPWTSAYKTTQLLRRHDNRFVLSPSGHIAGIVNPPSPKAKHWTNSDLPARRRGLAGRRRLSTRAPGGRTGPAGSASGPAPGARRRRSAAPPTRRSATPPGSTSSGSSNSADSRRTCLTYQAVG